MTRKMEVYTEAIIAKERLDACLRMLETAFSLAPQQEIRDAIHTAVLASMHAMRDHRDVINAAMHGVHAVVTEIVDGSAVEVPKGYSTKTQGIYTIICDSEGNRRAAVYPLSRGFVIKIGLNLMPELHRTRADALNFFFQNYLG